MQLNPNEPIVTFSVPMQQEDVHAWIMKKSPSLEQTRCSETTAN
ncbi:hypothetical protein ABN063_05980 [Providencia vermicola]